MSPKYVFNSFATINGKRYVLVQKPGFAYQSELKAIPVGSPELENVRNYERRL
jgi:hypothetical protein